MFVFATTFNNLNPNPYVFPMQQQQNIPNKDTKQIKTKSPKKQTEKKKEQQKQNLACCSMLLGKATRSKQNAFCYPRLLNVHLYI